MADDKLLHDLSNKLKQSKETEEALRRHVVHVVQLTRIFADLLNRKAHTIKQNGDNENDTFRMYQQKIHELNAQKHFCTTSLFDASCKLLNGIESEAESYLKLSKELRSMSQSLKATAARKETLINMTLKNYDEINRKVDSADITLEKAKIAYHRVEWDKYRDYYSKRGQSTQPSRAESAKKQACFTAHNNYVIAIKVCNELCSNVLKTYFPQLLDEIQGILNDLTQHAVTIMKKYKTLVSQELRSSQNRMTQLMATIESVHADSDISKFVVSQRPEDSLPTPAIVYKHPEPGYKDKNSDFKNELISGGVMEDTIEKDHKALQDEAVRVRIEIGNYADAENMTYSNLTVTSNQSDIGVLEGKLAEKKSKLKMFQIDQIVVAAKLELYEPNRAHYSSELQIRGLTDHLTTSSREEYNDDDTLVDSESSCGSFSTITEDDHRRRAHSFDCSSYPQESNDNPLSSTFPAPTQGPPVSRKPVRGSRSATLDSTRSRTSSLLQPNVLPTSMELPPSLPLRTCVVLHDYEAQQHDEHDLKVGDIIQVTQSVEKHWWKGTDFKGVNKLFPSSYVQVLQPGEKVVKVLYGYETSIVGEISLVEGKIVVLREDHSDGWSTVVWDNSSGLYPTNYLMEL
ncbi:uncharacterized protein [Dysidea avara]|uniref:uncharacterized protein n=1 Tax=Dysidea avara TaxID=196820 RepID=UPI00331B8768